MSDSESDDISWARMRRSRPRAQLRRMLAIALLLAAGGGLLGVAYAQSGNSFSLNSPVSFPVDI